MPLLKPYGQSLFLNQGTISSQLEQINKLNFGQLMKASLEEYILGIKAMWLKQISWKTQILSFQQGSISKWEFGTPFQLNALKYKIWIT